MSKADFASGVLDRAAAGDWNGAAALLASVEDRMAVDEATLLQDIVEDRRCCRQLATGLYFLDDISDDTLKNAAITAHGFVVAETGIAPLIVVETLPTSAPTHVRVSADGLGHVMIGGAAVSKGELVHEFAHCVAVSGVAFLDEGFATWLEARFEGRAINEETWPRPCLAALLEMDWQQDPHFETLDAPDPDAPYRLAAWMVASLVSASDSSALIGVIHALRRRTPSTDVAQALAASCGVHPDAIDRLVVGFPSGVLPDGAAILAEGAIDAARAALPALRAAAIYDLPNAREALIRVAVTIGVTTFEAEGQIARAEASANIKHLKHSGLASPLLAAYALILASFSASSPIERRATGARAAERFAQLLDGAANDPETLIAAAKAQTYSPSWFLPPAEWRNRLEALSTDTRFGRAARQLAAHRHFRPETLQC